MPRSLQFRALACLLIGHWSLVAGHSDAFGRAESVAERIGIMTHFAHGQPLDLIPPLAATGVRHVRDEIYWDQVEVAPGRFEFPKKFDAYMGALRRHDIRPLVPLTFESRHYDDGQTPHTEAGFQAYARYAVEVLRHYGDQIQAVEIWNEYNGGFIKGPATRDRSGTYAQMLRHAYAAIKRERPDVTVLGASTAGLPFPYLERLGEAGAFAHMDAVSIHPYRDTQPPETLEPAIRRLREIIARHSPDRPLPIWVTEIGWPARPPGADSGPPLDEDTQAAYLVRCIAILLHVGVEKVYWYQFLEHGVDAGLGMLRNEPGFPPKPSHAAFVTLLAQLRGVATMEREPAAHGIYSFALRPAPHSPAPPPARLLWSLKPVRIPTHGATRLVRLDGTSETPPDWIVLTDRPIYLHGATASPAPAPGQDDPPAPLADSAADFSFEQDRGGWSYGSMVFSRTGSVEFTRLTHHRVTDWKEEWFIPGTPLSISADEQHPASAGGRPVAAVRRWTSERGGMVRVQARFESLAPGQGDGVRVRVLADEQVRASEVIGGSRRPSFELAFDCELPPGGHLDFAVDPGPGGTPHHDATRVSVSILPTATTPAPKNHE
jgi:hypothetical protein